MALTFLNGAQPYLDLTGFGVTLHLDPAFNVSTGLTSTDDIEVRRAPDSVGAPGTPETIAKLRNPSARGETFVDPRPQDGAVWWYSHRHIKADGAVGGTWSAWVPAIAKPVLRGDQNRLGAPPPGVAGATDSTSRYRVAAVRNTVNITNNTQTLVPFTDADLYDIGNLHDPSSSPADTKIVIPSINYLGVWSFQAEITFDQNATGFRRVIIMRNGSSISAVVRSVISGSSIEIVNLSGLYSDPSPGDYFQVEVLQNSGGSLAVGGFFRAVHLW